MLTVILALALFILLHQSNEGIARFRLPVPVVLAAVQVGRVRVIMRCYRPRRVYFQFVFA